MRRDSGSWKRECGLFLAAVLVAVPGAADWVRAWGAEGEDHVAAVAAGPDGSVVSAGQFTGTVAIGTVALGTVAIEAGGEAGRLTATGDEDVFVARHGADGELLWALAFGGAAEDEVGGLAVAPDGSVYVTGFFQGTASFGDDELVAAGSTDLFLLRITAGGEPVWARGFGDAHADAGQGLAVGLDGAVYLGMTFQKSAALAGGAHPFRGRTDALLARLTPGGEVVWTRALGGSGRDSSHAVTVSGTGDVHWQGQFEGDVELSGGEGSLSGHAQSDIFLATLGSDGVLQRLVAFGGEASDIAAGIAGRSGGGVWVAGSFSGALVAPGDETLAATGVIDSFVAALDADGTVAWLRHLAPVDRVVARAVSGDGAGGLLVGGLYYGGVDFDPGDGEVQRIANRTDGFLLGLDAEGRFVRVEDWHGDEVVQVIAVAAAGGRRWAGGFFTEEASEGALRLTSAGYRDALLIGLDAPAAE